MPVILPQKPSVVYKSMQVTHQAKSMHLYAMLWRMTCPRKLKKQVWMFAPWFLCFQLFRQRICYRWQIVLLINSYPAYIPLCDVCAWSLRTLKCGSINFCKYLFIHGWLEISQSARIILMTYLLKPEFDLDIKAWMKFNQTSFIT